MASKVNIRNRLKRVGGQLQKVTDMIDRQDDCSEVITQFLAVKGALDAAFESYVQDSLVTCSVSDTTSMKKLIKTLIRK